jgi:uncharacterized protein (DUF1786 family)
MKILAIDIGTGTQDILLYDSQLDLENAYKLVLPSPTLIVNHQVKEATRLGVPIVLTGVTMGGGPSGWAIEDHLKAGYPVFATPDAARTLNDDLEMVKALGISLISEDEARHMPHPVFTLELCDFDFDTIRRSFSEFHVSLDNLACVAIAVFDHGAAPPGVSDRKFRFDYLDHRIRAENKLSAFAYRREGIPTRMTRMQAVAKSTAVLNFPVIIMDTAPAAVLGATFDPVVTSHPQTLVANIGNFHSLAFRLGVNGIEGVFEHHTGELNPSVFNRLLGLLADGTLKNSDVFDHQGHGALVYNTAPMPLNNEDFNVVVTGPRRSILNNSVLKPYLAVPFGDMMMTGCYGLLAAAADIMPDLHDIISASLHNREAPGKAPWDSTS